MSESDVFKLRDFCRACGFFDRVGGIAGKCWSCREETA